MTDTESEIAKARQSAAVYRSEGGWKHPLCLTVENLIAVLENQQAVVETEP